MSLCTQTLLRRKENGTMKNQSIGTAPFKANVKIILSCQALSWAAFPSSDRSERSFPWA